MDRVPAELRIGVHPSDRCTQALRGTGVLEERLAEVEARATWVDIDDGRRTIDLVAAGDVHLVGTGLTPPLRAQSEGVDIVYVAASEPRPVRGVVVVRAGAPLRNAGELRGRRVALRRGTAPTHLLALVLDRAGIAHRDVDVVLAEPDRARAALLAGEIDAWVDTDDRPGGREAALRELAGSEATAVDRVVWFARRDVAAARPDVVAATVLALRDADACRPWRPLPVSRRFLAEQQQTADLFAGQGVIQLPVDVAAAVPVSVSA